MAGTSSLLGTGSGGSATSDLGLEVVGAGWLSTSGAAWGWETSSTSLLIRTDTCEDCWGLHCIVGLDLPSWLGDSDL